MPLCIQYVFGNAQDPVKARSRMDLDGSVFVDEFQELVLKKHGLQFPVIELWRLNEPASIDDIRNKIVNVRDASKIGVWMHPFEPLSNYGDCPRSKIHVVIITHSLGTTMAPPADPLFATREGYLQKKLPENAPSAAAFPREFSNHQRRNQYPILCNRPPDAAGPLPTTLLHPIFGRFLDLCDTHEPTPQDNKLALDISMAMSKIFPDEASRATEFRSILRGSGITVEDGSVGASGRRRTDGHYRFREFPLLIMEAKNEIGGDGEADPFFQAICSYGNFLQEKSEPWKYHSVLPCFHIILIGPCIAISSSAFTIKIHADILGPIIPLFTHSTDKLMQKLTARTFGALRIALKDLKSYYKALPPTPQQAVLPFDPDCPYPKSYSDQSGEYEFVYNNNQPNSGQRIFFAKVQGGEEICIKFVKQYSPEAHRLCAEKGHAPRLLACNLLTGGWKMVVMEVLNIFESESGVGPPNSYHQFTYERDAVGNSRPLQNAIKALVKHMHDGGYVHGDLRDKNVFVKNDTTPSTDFMLLDFDWGGESGVARYPICVNRRQVRRPKGAIDGMKILPDHDRKMVEYMFDFPPGTDLDEEEMAVDEPEV